MGKKDKYILVSPSQEIPISRENEKTTNLISPSQGNPSNIGEECFQL